MTSAAVSKLNALDTATRAAASHVHCGPKPPRQVLKRFPAGGPRGSRPADEYAHQLRREGVPAEVVMDLASDAFLVVVQPSAL